VLLTFQDLLTLASGTLSLATQFVIKPVTPVKVVLHSAYPVLKIMYGVVMLQHRDILVLVLLVVILLAKRV